MNTKKLLALLLAALMVVAMAACNGGGNNSSTPAAPDGSSAPEGSDAPDATPTVANEFTVQIGPNPETLDPALNSAVDGGNMLITLFETLLIIDENLEVQPGQAER